MDSTFKDALEHDPGTELKYNHRIPMIHVPMIGYLSIQMDLLKMQPMLRSIRPEFNILMVELVTNTHIFDVCGNVCSNYETRIMANESDLKYVGSIFETLLLKSTEYCHLH